MTASSSLASRHTTTALICAAVALGMVGAAYAAVPLYRLFCQVTGYGGTTQVRAEAPGAIGERMMTVRFNTDISSNLPWSFEPPPAPVTIRVGAETLVAFKATNRSKRTMTATATFNVTPDNVGIYFSKIQCFCFTEQVLNPGESVEMPVVFFIDPEILQDRHFDPLKTVTLSYTLYPVEDLAKKKRPVKLAAAVPKPIQ
ncbi:MAG: cytochrome c oxidase assembly protein [Alphaproteobacteria bacterium]|nr:cytochrome c oxidase assembly protein [Alphaproteobacteria bacterium]